MAASSSTKVSLFADPHRGHRAAPEATASFAQKRTYYRSLHTSIGVRATHLFGIPMITLSLPLIFAKPKCGAKMFIAGWGLQIAGHKIFEKNTPAIKEGIISYQLIGLAVWAEDVVSLISRFHAVSEHTPLKRFHVAKTTTTDHGKIFELEAEETA